MGTPDESRALRNQFRQRFRLHEHHLRRTIDHVLQRRTRVYAKQVSKRAHLLDRLDRVDVLGTHPEHIRGLSDTSECIVQLRWIVEARGRRHRHFSGDSVYVLSRNARGSEGKSSIPLPRRLRIAVGGDSDTGQRPLELSRPHDAVGREGCSSYRERT